REMMRDVINAKGIGSNGCFKQFTGGVGFCGNGIIEGDEECDCGPEVNCMSSSNICCNPTNCTLYPTIQCDPGQGTCCNVTCQFVDATFQCAAETECANATNCLGTSAQCPTPA
ncbi:hypothetical protein, partial [Salmonella sp. s51228]|uniref:hypothetical protein n=1 Tax=Salmonella sp. s51228 TaxID=3159652 RepID=UPI00397EE4FB